MALLMQQPQAGASDATTPATTTPGDKQAGAAAQGGGL